MKLKGLLAIFAAFIMSATIFAVGCENFNTGGGSLLRPGPSFGNGDRDKTDDTDDDDDVPSQGQINSKPVPEFTITNQNGAWTLQGAITVLNDGCFVPGRWGQDSFIIKSECDEVVNFSLLFSETLDGESVADPFMTYRVKYNGKFLGDWQHAEFEYGNIQILPGSEQIWTLEWQSPFESDNEYTYENFKGKQLTVNVLIWSEEVIDKD